MSKLKQHNISINSIKYLFMNKSNKILHLNNLKEKCLLNISNMELNINLCIKFYQKELDDSFYNNKSNYNIFKHLYRNSTKCLKYNLCELNKINNLLLKLED